MLFCRWSATSLVVEETSRSAVAAASNRSLRISGAIFCSRPGAMSWPARRGTAAGSSQKIPAASRTSKKPVTLREANIAKKP